jgi:hypothetical protein
MQDLIYAKLTDPLRPDAPPVNVAIHILPDHVDVFAFTGAGRRLAAGVGIELHDGLQALVWTNEEGAPAITRISDSETAKLDPAPVPG